MREALARAVASLGKIERPGGRYVDRARWMLLAVTLLTLPLKGVLLADVTAAPTGTPTATATVPPTACVGDCNGDGQVTVDEILTMVSIALGNAACSSCVAAVCCDAADCPVTVTVDQIVTAVNNALNGCIALPTPTATPTVAPTFGVLGLRHFAVNPKKSLFQVRFGGLTLPLGQFQGQTNGQAETAFLDFDAGQPDASGIATINLTNSSEFIYADATAQPGAGIVLCIKPLVPVMDAGVVTCNGGLALGFALTQDHDIGKVGVNGFTTAQCQTMNGQVEMSTCTAGKTRTTCQVDADCDTSAGSGDGTCTPPLHPDVCNGPFVASLFPGDTGPGGVTFAPVPQFQLNGLPVRLSIQSSLPCVDPGPSANITLAFTSGASETTILDVNDTGTNGTGTALTFTAHGQNFSCADWQAAGAPGRLVLTAPQLDQSPIGDIITSFTLDGSP